MGKCLPDSWYSVTLLDHDGVPVPPGVEGEISVKAIPHPPGLFLGYLGRDTSKVFSGGMYRTGDRAVRDVDGYFWFVGRADDVIKTSDYRVGPFEVESCLIEHPAVLESAVVGRPDHVRGQIVKAFVSLRSGYVPSAGLADDLFQFTRQHLAPMKCPRVIEFASELPKTASGKIRRVELRALEEKRFREGVTDARENEYFLGKHSHSAKL
jgi:acyl-coenzyme A synthetase/AMP-(fatty) acid ligase